MFYSKMVVLKLKSWLKMECILTICGESSNAGCQLPIHTSALYSRGLNKHQKEVYQEFLSQSNFRVGVTIKFLISMMFIFLNN